MNKHTPEQITAGLKSGLPETSPKVSENHTPGPWTIKELGPTDAKVRISPYASEYIRIYGANATSNARLIAAAPELLAALQRGTDLCERGHGREWADEAKAVIAKAIGA